MRVLTAAGTDMERRMLLLASSLSLPFRTDPVRTTTSVEGFSNADGKGVMLLVPREILHAIDNAMGVSAEADRTNRERLGMVSRTSLFQCAQLWRARSEGST